MAIPVIEWQQVLQRIIRTAYTVTLSRTAQLLALCVGVSALLSYSFHLFLKMVNFPLIHLSDVQTAFAPFLENSLARTVAYLFAFDQIAPIADFIFDYGISFVVLLPVVVNAVLIYTVVVNVRRAMRGDKKDVIG